MKQQSSYDQANDLTDKIVKEAFDFQGNDAERKRVRKFVQETINAIASIAVLRVKESRHEPE